ncbi:E3 ubiquitin/ISG15 ligase TRIM25-like [Dendropsophus ebraccatus]|uniref:E3 ubiquitin/ISG15 ligase TRIM25-like n=1 Tax=Dendropsophus ebraccatus TaxID=150705 RepID=UPI003831E471
MASAALRDELDCSVCLITYTDPVMLRCGHNFCRLCIGRVLDTQDGAGVYSCPECREEYQERPALMRNIALRNLMENILLTPPTPTESGICCTYCVDSAVPAVISCLLCEASLCDKHLRAHSKSPEHVLSEPSTSLEKRKCSVHKKMLEYYCTEDAICICVSCRLDGEHRGHRVEMLDEASGKKKKKLRNVLQKLMAKRKETEERVRSVEERRRKAQEKAAGEAERVTALFTDIRRRLDDLEKRVLSEISRQQKKESLSLSALIQQLEIKKDELSRKMRHIEELCNMADPLTVLQDPETGDLCDPEEGGGDEDTGGHDRQLHDVDDLDVAVISDTFSTLCDIISGIRSGIYVKSFSDILLDVNTANKYLHISWDLKTATWTLEKQNRPETAERFQYDSQVMSSRRFSSGQHYWDVQSSGSGQWMVGMCYPSIDREVGLSYIGDDIKSWSLRGECRNKKYSVIHNCKVVELPHQISSNRVRICLDYEAGQLSFYELCYPIKHLHTFTTTFTEPLHAAVWVLEGSIKIGRMSKWEQLVRVTRGLISELLIQDE